MIKDFGRILRWRGDMSQVNKNGVSASTNHQGKIEVMPVNSQDSL